MDVPGNGIEQRESAMRALLLFTAPAAVLLMVLNWHLRAPLLAATNLVLALISVGLLYATRRGLSRQALALGYLVVLVINILAALAEPNVQPGATSSVSIIPVLAYLLLDARVALPVTGAALAAALAAYFAGAAVAPYRLTPLMAGHMAAPAVLLFAVCHFYSRGRTRAVQHMLERALRDPLTDLWNREKLMSAYQHERRRAQRQGTPISLVLIDLDHFKELNDRFGHDAGDAALVYVARLMKRRLRAIDLACRIGGEEFALLLPDTPASGAFAVADTLRRALESTRFRYRGQRIGMTLSAGVAELGRDGDEWLQLYRAADARLYACKAQGRNCVLSGPAEAA